jgi:hypothetical protein
MDAMVIVKTCWEEEDKEFEVTGLWTEEMVASWRIKRLI